MNGSSAVFYAFGGKFFVRLCVKKIANIVGHFDQSFNFHVRVVIELKLRCCDGLSVGDGHKPHAGHPVQNQLK